LTADVPAAMIAFSRQVTGHLNLVGLTLIHPSSHEGAFHHVRFANSRSSWNIGLSPLSMRKRPPTAYTITQGVAGAAGGSSMTIYRSGAKAFTDSTTLLALTAHQRATSHSLRSHPPRSHTWMPRSPSIVQRRHLLRGLGRSLRIHRRAHRSHREGRSEARRRRDPQRNPNQGLYRR